MRMNEGNHFLNPYILFPMLLLKPHPFMLSNDWSDYAMDGVGSAANGF